MVNAPADAILLLIVNRPALPALPRVTWLKLEAKLTFDKVTSLNEVPYGWIVNEPVVLMAELAPNEKLFVVSVISLVDDATLEVTPLTVTAELLPSLIAPPFALKPESPPAPAKVIGPFLDKMYAVPPLPLKII